MTAEEFERWLPAMRDAYADDVARNGGGTAEAARRKAEADVERLFPGSAPVPEQLVFVVEADGGPVGDLWLSSATSTSGVCSGSTTCASRSGTAAAATGGRR